MNQGIKTLFSNKTFCHLVFWLSYVAFYGTLWGSYDGEWEESFVGELIYLPVKVAITYYSIYVLLPKFVLKGKWVTFILLLLLSALAAGIAQRLISYYIVYPLYYPQYLDSDPIVMFKVFKGIVGIYPVVFLAAAIKVLKFWYVNQQDRQILTNEKLESELKLLRTQIHPHFLFNTLNNLYALTLKKSDQAPAMVLKLSELISYMLYDCNAPKVLLNDELKFVENYIEIEKMRHGDQLTIKSIIEGETSKVYLAPMMILPFLENSFKHGVNEELNQSWVSLNLKVLDEQLTLDIKNSKSDTQQLSNQSEGIGLKNVKRRLDLLYKEQYTLEIIDQPKTFEIKLVINLSSALIN